MGDVATSWVRDECQSWRGNDPAELLEYLMADERCPTFGPLHHELVGAALLACSWDAEGIEGLGSALDELASRATCVPGASCARWGVCGAAASCGMAFAILAQNAPLKADGWGEGQLMVAEILTAIARSGAPRCCKRDARIAVRVAAPWFNEHLGTGFAVCEGDPVCTVSSQNSVCLHGACPYYREAR